MENTGKPRSKKINPYLFEKILERTEKYAKTSIENKDIAVKWLDISKNDIQITKILYEKKYYAGAVYHLQQAFEKLAKGYYILTGRMSPEKAMNHKFVIEKLKSEIKDDYLNDLAEISSAINKKEISLKQSEEGLTLLEKSEDEIRMIKSEDIGKIFEIIKTYETKLKSKENLDYLEKRTLEKGFLKIIKHLLFKITHFRVYDSQVREAIQKQRLMEYLEEILLGIRLHYLSILTFPHYNTPRYPNNPNTEVTFFFYDEKSGIVSYLKELISSFEEIYALIIKKGLPPSRDGK